MVRVPAVCDSCGGFFPSSIQLSNATGVNFTANRVGPCPRCGGNGHIPDGAYNFIGNAIELLSGPARSKSDLERLAAILRSAQQRGASAADIRKEVTSQIPELQSIADLLPRTRRELYPFIMVLLTILAILLSQLHRGQPPKVEIHQVINQITTVVEQPRKTAVQPHAPSSKGSKPAKVGSNDPCPCGSGKKYKKCHMIKH
jgi:SEC-C motif-containing protein